VAFYQNNQLLSTVTTAPYAYDWTDVQPGTYQITAQATDDRNLPTTSTILTITVTEAIPQAYYIHTDQLDTPRRITDQNNTVVWRWDSDPFGATPANEDPDGNSQPFEYNQRFPGQYADKETGLHYNYFRDYDPGTGRYIESDPIGLAGGQFSTYAYVDGNPLQFSDATGLCPVCGLLAIGLIANEIANSDVPIIGGCVANAGAAAAEGIGKACLKKNVVSYEVGPYNALRNRSALNDGLDLHHAMQRQPASQVIDGYNPLSAPSIALPRNEHLQIPNLRGDYGGTARELLAQDIRNLRNYTNTPNSALQQLIELNKQMYPDALKK